MYCVVQFHFLCIHMISITLKHTEAQNHRFSCVVSDTVVFVFLENIRVMRLVRIVALQSRQLKNSCLQ